MPPCVVSCAGGSGTVDGMSVLPARFAMDGLTLYARG